MLVAALSFVLAGVFGWVAVVNGPARFGRWIDAAGRSRFGGALNWPIAAFWLTVGLMKLLRHP